MSAIRVLLGARSYPIHLAGSYQQLPQALRRAGLGPHGIIVSHASLLQRFGPQLLRALRRADWHLTTLTIPESETSKSSQVVERLIRQIVRRATAHPQGVPVLFAFGGGVVGDVTGYVAAVYRRGVPYVQLPTTLLAQVDSAIGGKVGVDLPDAKNAVGAFYQPRLVYSNLSLLSKLPLRQRRSGLSEIIKYAAIADAPLFAFLEAHVSQCLRGSLRVDRVMVERCSRIKARVVSQDEREARGKRTVLNFGHTLGHALEAATGYRRFTHGEAIAVGMACASDLSVRMGLLDPVEHARLANLLERIGLPTAAGGVRLAAVRRALRHDKKFIHGSPRWVLLTRLGRAMVSDSVPAPLMWQVLGDYIESV